MDWQKKAPDKAGYWIRLNAVHRPEVVYVAKNELMYDGELYCTWGWGGEREPMIIKDNLHKIEKFWWSDKPLTELPPRK